MKKALKIILTILFWIAAWQLAAFGVSSVILLPSPADVFKALLSLVSTGEFYISVMFSVIRITCGFICGSVLGIICGTLSFKSKLLNTLLSPVASVIKSTPVASFIVLLFVWFSNGTVAAVTSALIVIPVMWSNTFTSLSQTDKNLIEMADVFKVPYFKKIKEIYIPSITPSLKSAAATSLGLAWKAGVAAEVICSPKNSIGGGIYSSKVYLETPSLFAWTAVVIAVSVILEKLLIKLINRKNTKGGKA